MQPKTQEITQAKGANLANIPQAFRDAAQWVCWRFHEVDGRRTKPPTDAKGRKVSATDPKNFMSFAEALAAYQGGATVDGIGFALIPNGGLCCIDIDHCFNEGRLLTQAWMVLKDIGPTYVEKSPSGEGLHVWIKADLPDGMGGRRFKTPDGAEVEIYNHGRFLTMTGKRFEVAGYPHHPHVEAKQAEVNALIARLEAARQSPPPAAPAPSSDAQRPTSTASTGGETPPPVGASPRPDWRGIALDFDPIGVEDEKLIAAILATPYDGAKFKALQYEGDVSFYGGDESRADLGLLDILAKWTRGDTRQMCRIFTSSKLAAREKTETRDDYVARTIATALVRRDGTIWNPDAPPPGMDAAGTPYLADTARAADAAQAREEREEREREYYHGPNDETPDAFLRLASMEKVDAFREETEDLSEMPVINTGLEPLDKYLQGLRGGQVYTIAAMPGLGKTSLISQIADSMAEAGQDIVFFTLEVTERQIMAKSLSRRMWALADGNPALALSAGEIDKGKFLKWGNADLLAIYDRACREYKAAAKGRIWLVQGQNRQTGTDDMRAFLDRYKRHFPDKTPIVFLDYFQLLRRSDPRATDKQSADDNIQSLRTLAKHFRLPLFSISSLNRSGYQAPDDMSGLKESGMIEYSSDVIIILKYINKHGQNSGPKEARAEVDGATVFRVGMNVLKNRHEEKGELPGGLLFYPRFGFYTANDGTLARIDNAEELGRGAEELKTWMDELGEDGIVATALKTGRKKAKEIYKAVGKAYRGEEKGAPRFNQEEMAAVIEEAKRRGHVVEVERIGTNSKPCAYIIAKDAAEEETRKDAPRQADQGELFGE